MKNFFSRFQSSSKNLSLSLALRFMILLALAMISLSLLFVTLLRASVTKKQNLELEKSISFITDSLTSSGIDELSFLELPYYITYVLYEKESKKILAKNDSLLPLLDSAGKSLTFYEKNFFTDGDLFIRYRTKEFDFHGKKIIIECAFDIANDSAENMSRQLLYLALYSILPVLLLSFALSFLISRKTISAFKRLQEDYDREKAFTSNVSHELKTPISIIDGHANLLKRWGKDDPIQLSQSIDAILQESQNMNSIVTTLLDMSRLENGKIKIEKEKFFVTNLFSSLKKEFKILHPEMTFIIDDQDYIQLESDQAKLHQIFTVILSNSLKFAGEKCKITLASKKIAGKIHLCSEDDGPGFPPDSLPHVFERFYKGDSSHDRNVSGAGLGLSIAKSLAQALGAEIQAENINDVTSEKKVFGARVSLIF